MQVNRISIKRVQIVPERASWKVLRENPPPLACFTVKRVAGLAAAAAAMARPQAAVAATLAAVAAAAAVLSSNNSPGAPFAS